MQMTFTDLNTRLMNDLHLLWEDERISKMGPIMQRFLAHEKKIAETYGGGLARVMDKSTPHTVAAMPQLTHARSQSSVV